MSPCHPELHASATIGGTRDAALARSAAAWSRFAWWTLAAHGVVAATWFAGRTALSGREVSSKARSLTRVKDVLIVASLVTGVSSVIIGKILGANAKRQRDEGRDSDATVEGLRTAVKAVGAANIATNAMIGAVTTSLAMEGAKSPMFAAVARFLP